MADPFAGYVREAPGGVAEASLIVRDVHDAAALEAVERALLEEGALWARLRLEDGRAVLRWHPAHHPLGHFLAVLERLGHRATPYDPATQEQHHRVERRRALARLGVAGFGAGNVMMLSTGLYVGAFVGIDPFFKSLLQWVSAPLAAPVVFYGGWPFLRGAWQAARARRFTMDTLISLGLLITFGTSLAALAVPGAETYFDSVSMVVFFLLIGRTVETVARSRGTGIVEGLLALQGRWAQRIEGTATRLVPVASLRPGERIAVRTGDAVAADGVIADGETTLDESALTGEPGGRAAGPGERVLAGSVNLGAPILVDVRVAGGESALARICRLVQQTEAARTTYRRNEDRVAGLLFPLVALAALGALAYWSFLAPAPPASPWLIALSVLVVACPCALALATPIALLMGNAAAAARGILVRNRDAMEAAAQVTDLVLDKTGTLTLGRPRVEALADAAAISTREWFAAAAALATAGVHPLGEALVRHWQEWGGTDQPLPRALDVSVHAGLGLVGTVGGRRIVVGSPRLLRREGIDTGAAERCAGAPGSQQVLVAVEQRLAGAITLADALRPDARETLDRLRALGLRLHLFSGDRAEAVQELAQRLALADARGALLPGEKAEAIRALQAQGRSVAMLGDGINDAPALAQADLGMALATGADLALEAAQVLLLRPRLRGAAETIELARRTRRIVRQNLRISLAYNAVVIPTAMAGLITPLLAALAMSSSSLIVVLNALRLRRGPPLAPDPPSPPGAE